VSETHLPPHSVTKQTVFCVATRSSLTQSVSSIHTAALYVMQLRK